MSIWEKFELDCTEYLNNKFGAYASFIHQGGADSTVPDILVKTKSNKSFYIDAKHCPSQCGQFVLLPDIETSSFIYSQRNTSQINTSASKIMKYMNNSFNEYREAGTSGKNINIPESDEIFSKWIIDMYYTKGVRFFITNNFVILSIDRFIRYFNITAKYRIKRSGSGSVGKKSIDTLSKYISDLDFPITETRAENNKLFVISATNLHNKRFILNSNEYMFSLRNGEEYEIRKLSNTYNANVIFSITRKGNEPGISDAEFISYLQN